jgi:hypothetical protein
MKSAPQDVGKREKERTSRSTVEIIRSPAIWIDKIGEPYPRRELGVHDIHLVQEEYHVCVLQQLVRHNWRPELVRIRLEKAILI